MVIDMRILAKKVNIPPYLHELHGKQSSIFELLITYTTAALYAVIVLYLARHLPVYKLAVLGFLSIDLAGGVVSNFTEGTNLFYIQRPKMRYMFISLHILQPVILMLLFPNELKNIAIISVYTLMAMIFINSLSAYLRQRLYAAALTALGLTISFALNISQPIVHLMLILFVIKLILAFSVRWK